MFKKLSILFKFVIICCTNIYISNTESNVLVILKQAWTERTKYKKHENVR